MKKQLFASEDIRQVDYAYAIDENSTIYRPDGIRFHAQKLATEYAKLREKLEDVCSRTVTETGHFVDTMADRNRSPSDLDLPRPGRYNRKRGSSDELSNIVSSNNVRHCHWPRLHPRNTGK